MRQILGTQLAYIVLIVCSLGITRHHFKRGNDMAEDTKIESVVSEEKTRRSAIKTAAQVAVTAPAVAMLLSASAKAQVAPRAYDKGTAGLTGEEPSGDKVDDNGPLDDAIVP